ncbi:amidohydrolase family protein [Thalassotalea fusca]
MKIIDPHVHLFDLTKGQYHWLKATNPPFWKDKNVIAKNFSQHSLSLTNFELGGFVHIEAGFNNQQPTEELAWLEQTVNKPFKSIATFNLLAQPKSNQELLAKLAQFHSYVGVRHILDDDAKAILMNPIALKNFQLLNNTSAIFELQVCLSDNAIVSTLASVITSHPNIRFVLNHAGFPPYLPITGIDGERKLQWQYWQENIKQLATIDNVWIKCSGWEMADRQYQATWQKQVISAVISQFSHDKIMMASNFPLTLFSREYNLYWQQTLSLLPEHLQTKLCYSNAQSCYGFA